MDHTRDNPLKRFTAFWIALLLVTAFGIALILVKPFAPDKVDEAYLIMGEERAKIKDGVDRAQDAALNLEKLATAKEAQAKAFASNKETKSSMAVPGAAPSAEDATTAE